MLGLVDTAEAALTQLLDDRVLFQYVGGVETVAVGLHVDRVLVLHQHERVVSDLASILRIILGGGRHRDPALVVDDLVEVLDPRGQLPHFDLQRLLARATVALDEYLVMGADDVYCFVAAAAIHFVFFSR